MKRVLAFTLAFLAKKILLKYKPKIIGIAGGFGKSSTKEAIFHVLSSEEKSIRRNRGSLNNEFGLPLAIIGDFFYAGGVFFYLKAILKGAHLWFFNNDYPKILILEYGADKPGDIEYLTYIARPDIAIITGISDIPVHVEFYPSPEAVAEEEFKLVRALTENGVAILNADDAMVSKMAEKTAASTLFYGFSPEADFRISQFSNRSQSGMPLGIAFKLETIGKSAPVIIDGVLGRGVAYAAAAVAACGSVLNISLVKVSAEMSSIKPIPGRAKIIEGADGSWIIDDTYNSSPAALREALSSLKSISATRKIAVLGGMMELGKYSETAHQALGREASEAADIVIGIGEKGRTLINAATQKGKKTAWFENSIKAADGVKKIVCAGDLVLVKGSQSVRTERIVKALMKHPEKANQLLVRQYGGWLKK